jgi:putative lipoic acid-binding regulatory protein
LTGTVTATDGAVGGWVIEDDQIVGKNNSLPSITLDSGQGANVTYDGNDATGIVFGTKNQNVFLNSNFTSSAWTLSDVGGAAEGLFFRAGVKNTYIKLTTINGMESGSLEVSSSNFSINSDGDVTMTGTVSASAGSIGGWTIANNQLTGSSGAIISTADTGQRIKISGTDNTIKFFTTGTSAELMDIGLVESNDLGSGNVINKYGVELVGSAASSKVASSALIKISNADVLPNSGVYTNTYGSIFANIQSFVDIEEEENVLLGRPSIYGEFKSTLASDVATVGLISGVTGRIIESTSGRWDMSAGVVGISSAEDMDTTHEEGGGVPDGVYGVVSIGDAYVKGDLAVTGEVGIGDTTPDYPLDVEGQVSNISIYAEYDIAAYSDIRVKTDIETITEPLNKVLKMRGVTFRRIDSDLDKRQMGVIAQEVEPYVPEVVSTVEDESSDKYGHKSVSYGNLTALLIEAIKEQQKQIEELKQQVKEIKDAVSK